MAGDDHAIVAPHAWVALVTRLRCDNQHLAWTWLHDHHLLLRLHARLRHHRLLVLGLHARLLVLGLHARLRHHHLLLLGLLHDRLCEQWLLLAYDDHLFFRHL